MMLRENRLEPQESRSAKPLKPEGTLAAALPDKEPGAPVEITSATSPSTARAYLRRTSSRLRRRVSTILARARVVRERHAILLAILGVAAVLRFWGITFGYPGRYRPDEEYLVNAAVAFHSGDLNPRFFIYPTLYMYCLSFVFGLVRIIVDALAIFGAGDFMAFAHEYHDAPLHVIARATTASLGVVGVLATYLLGRRAYGHVAGLIAAGVLAVNFTHVRESHFATTDVPMALLATFALFALLGLAEHGGLKRYAVTGLLGGLAASVKYPAAALLAPLFVAGALRAFVEIGDRRKRETRSRWATAAGVGGRHAASIGLAGLLFLLGFVAGSPFFLMELRTVRANIAYQLPFVRDGVAGLSMPFGWNWLFAFGLRYAAGPLLEALFLAALSWIILSSPFRGVRRSASGLVLASFIVALTVPYVRTRWIFLRYMTPLMPVLAVVVAGLVIHVLAQRVWARRSTIVALVLVGVAGFDSAYRSFQTSRLLGVTDTRQEAYEWIRSHLPQGADIAVHQVYMYGKPQLPRGYRYVDITSADGALARWALVDDSPIRFYSPPLPAPAMERLHDFGRLMIKFDPFNSGRSERAVYDPADAFYLPIAGFSAVRRPGPIIRIYVISSEPAPKPRTDCGLLGRYFANTTWSNEPDLTRIDNTLIFDWQMTPPLSTPIFSAEWRGFLDVIRGGDYAFRLESDDGSFLYVDDRLVIDNGGIHHPISKSGTIRLTPGPHAILLRYANVAFTGMFKVYWTPPGARERFLECDALLPPRAEGVKKARPRHAGLRIER